jgi:hypothetical protein
LLGTKGYVVVVVVVVLKSVGYLWLRNGQFLLSISELVMLYYLMF